jgi:hypothetical protein
MGAVATMPIFTALPCRADPCQCGGQGHLHAFGRAWLDGARGRQALLGPGRADNLPARAKGGGGQQVAGHASASARVESAHEDDGGVEDCAG